jgi:outer membrane protein assembly factor BamB
MSLAICLAFILTVLPSDGNWPGFRGHGDSHAEAKNLPLQWSDKKNVAWSIELPGYGQSSPVVWKDRVFLTSVQGKQKEKLIVLCVNLAKGNTLWRQEAEASTTAEDKDTISKAAPTPAVDSNRVYAFFESGDLMALDHKGKFLWQRKLSQEYGSFSGNHGLGASIALTDRAVIVLIAHRGPSYLLAVDKSTGKTLWKTERAEGGSWSSPVVISYRGRQIVIVSSGGSVEAYDAEQGKQTWIVTGLKGNHIPSPSIENNVVVVGSGDKGANVAIRFDNAGNDTKTQISWHASEATAYFNSPLIYRGRVYFINKVGVVYCLDLNTGEELWKTRIGGECWASPLAAGDRIYFFKNDGTTVVMRAQSKLEILAENTLHEGNRVYGVAAVDSALLIRSGRRLTRLSNL